MVTLIQLTALLYYDYILTLTTEIKRFWSTFKLTWTSLLYILNRVFSLLGHLPVVAVYFSELTSNDVRS